ncbi:hypothetical protein A2U01_0073049, partial [Trifolium medium]|nr:hypothetical protein [Trifolium medium]
GTTTSGTRHMSKASIPKPLKPSIAFSLSSKARYFYADSSSE